MLNEFIEYLENQVKNGSIYVWGAQGQKDISEAWIRERETSERNAKRAINLWQKRVKEGYNALRAYDCSGLGMYFLFDMKGVFKEDTNAHGMMTMKCDRISRDELKRGDWVFRVSYGRAYHIGYVVDDELNVIEAKGRDDGVIKGKMNYSYFNAYGRPKFFKEEIYEGSRELRLRSPMMRGEDVKALQEALHKAGYKQVTGAVDGVFGKDTDAGVRKFQKAKKLTVDGIAGEKTFLALGLEWR